MYPCPAPAPAAPGRGRPRILFLALLLLTPSPAGQLAGGNGSDRSLVTISGATVVHRRITLDLSGPWASEAGDPNPFLDWRMDVGFSHQASGTEHLVPGFFAADGQAQESGATQGNVWRARFTPDRAGTWQWRISFRAGIEVAIADDSSAGSSTPWNGLSGSFDIAPAGASSGSILRDGGRLVLAAGYHLMQAESRAPWLQMGPNSPENFLAYADFDQTPDGKHLYAPHIDDWQPGDPAWHHGGQGQGIIGALNYLAGKGVNTVSMLVFNVGGDGDDVWPWTDKGERLRYDCSKLAQWEIVFEHMDNMGLSPHLVLGEQEIDDGPLALDGGELGPERKLFHRELLARFGHHLGLVINLGEENQNTTAQQTAFYDHLRSLDPWEHPVVVHTFPTSIPVVYPPLIRAGVLQGASLQVLDPANTHLKTGTVRRWSEAVGLPWIVDLDEIGPPDTGALPDAADPDHDLLRTQVLWGNLMAGGAGCQWYFGYGWPNDDLNCEDFRSRDALWEQSALAHDLFMRQLPFQILQPADQLVLSGQAWCLADPGYMYAVYMPAGGVAQLVFDEPQSTWRVRWFDPRRGGPLIEGDSLMLQPEFPVDLRAPSQPVGADWLALIEHVGSAPQITAASTTPESFLGGDLTLSVSLYDPDDDVTGVLVHLFTPQGAWIATLPATQAGAAYWELALKNMPAPPAGSWPLMLQVQDALEHVTTRMLSVEVPPS